MVDIEAVLCSVLPPILGCPVATQRPSDANGPYVRVRATGGPGVRSEVLDEATVAWEASAPTEASSLAVAGAVMKAIGSMVGSRQSGAWICDARSTRPARFDDEDGVPRYVGTASFLIQIN